MPPPRGLFVGLTTLDLIHRVDRLPGADEKVTALSQELVAGGPAAVAALTFAALGGSATLLTGLGAHPLADLARADLQRHGVTVCDLAEHADQPAISSVRVHQADATRSISSPDAAGVPELSAPADQLRTLVDDADVVLLDGHHPGLAATVATAADAHHVPVLLDAGRWRPVFATLLPLARFVVASSAFALDGVPVAPEALVELGADAAARSAGPAPIRWSVPGESGAIEVRAVAGADTNGAGDVLHGAVAFTIAAVGASAALALWPQALRFAADVASVRVEHAGARAWLDDPRPRKWGQEWTT